MAEPEKETVRIVLPPRPEPAVAPPNVVKRDTDRIVLPTRTPLTPVRHLPPKITPLPSSSEARFESPAVLPRRSPVTPPTTSPLLQPLPKPPGVEKAGAPNDAAAASAGVQPAPVVITSKPLPRVDAIPRGLCWALLAISAVIFLIQIWNYVVS